jgi:hypothetical protein
VNEASGADPYLIMVIFRAVSSRDIRRGAYRATGAEYSLMLECVRGLFGLGSANCESEQASLVGRSCGNGSAACVAPTALGGGVSNGAGLRPAPTVRHARAGLHSAWHAIRDAHEASGTFQVDILPGRNSIRVTCLPERTELDWNCCRARWIC